MNTSLKLRLTAASSLHEDKGVMVYVFEDHQDGILCEYCSTFLYFSDYLSPIAFMFYKQVLEKKI